VAATATARSREAEPDVPPAPYISGASRQALIGFFLIGLLVALPGSLLPAWGYHFRPDFSSIGFHFLFQTCGVVITLRLARRILSWLGAQQTMVVALAIAVLGITCLGLSSSMGEGYLMLGRNSGLFLIGLACGGLMASAFHLVQPLYEHDPAGTVNLSGGLFGLGSLLPSLLASMAYSLTSFEGLLWVLTSLPALVAVVLHRSGRLPEPPLPDLGFREVFEELRSPVHVLFAAILFFQTAAELAVAGWTSLHLILRIGMSPSASLLCLSFYWFCLVMGRLVAQSLMRKVPHRRLLLTSAAMAWLGILLLAATDNRFGALLGLGLTALGFAFVYPLLVERIGSRFREYHASLFHGIFGIGMMGGFLAPALSGWVADEGGISLAMAVPMGASFMVFVLLFAIWVESKLSSLGTKASVPTDLQS
jgi:fucose permease